MSKYLNTTTTFTTTTANNKIIIMMIKNKICFKVLDQFDTFYLKQKMYDTNFILHQFSVYIICKGSFET